MVFIKLSLFFFLFLVTCWFIAIVLDTQQDIIRGSEYKIEKAAKEYFDINLRISFMEIVLSFIIVCVDIDSLGILVFIIVYSTIFYRLTKKLENMGGYTERLFDIVEAFSFFSILSDDYIGCIGYSLVIIAWIIVAWKIDDDINGLYLNVLALVEVWILCFINRRIANNNILHVICLIILPHSLLKLFNMLVVYVYEKLHFN